MLDEQIAAAEREPPWDDLRERRVLVRARAQFAERRARRRALVMGGGVAGLAAAAAIATWAIAGMNGTGGPRGAVTASATDREAPAQGERPSMVLLDGSRVVLSGGARAHVDVETPERVELSQASGEVRYEVTPMPSRAFIVRAGHVSVSVLGTIFVVGRDADAVAVRVVRGRVRVDDGARTIVLAPGESVRIAGAATARAPSTQQPRSEAPSAAPDLGAGERAQPSAPHRSTGEPQAPASPSFDALLAEADAARARHDADAGARTLRELASRFPRDPRTPSILFTLARIERQRGRHAEAGEAFAACHRAAPRGPLAEDALAEAAVSLRQAGRFAEARATAERYLERYPEGPNRERLSALLQ